MFQAHPTRFIQKFDLPGLARHNPVYEKTEEYYDGYKAYPVEPLAGIGLGLPPPSEGEETAKHIQIVFNDVLIADTRRAVRVLETSHPPVYYLPPEDVRMEYVMNAAGSSVCEWKGSARYHSVVVGMRIAEWAAWSYPSPRPGFESIRFYLAFYASRMDRCTVNGEEVRSQPDGFYGSWITSDIVGPFKGGPGSSGW